MQLVKGRAADAAAAVVPEGHGHPVGGIVGVGEVQKLVQRLGVAHVGGLALLQKLQALAVIEPALQFGGVHLIVLPDGRAAGLDDHVHVLRQFHFHHFGEIHGGKAAVALQIAAAEIPIDRPALPLRSGAVGDILRPAAGYQRQGHDHCQQAR